MSAYRRVYEGYDEPAEPEATESRNANGDEPAENEPVQSLQLAGETHSAQSSESSHSPQSRKSSSQSKGAPHPAQSHEKPHPAQSHGKPHPAHPKAGRMDQRVRAQVGILRRRVEQLTERTNPTPLEVAELKEKTLFLDSLHPPAEHHYNLPQTDQQVSDRKRKLELLRSAQPEHKQHKRRENHWETEQLKKAQDIVGANPDDISLPGEKHYDFVFDELQFVDFSVEAQLSGEEEDDDDDRVSSFADIQAVRRSLPAYRFRQPFLDQMAQNQVVIVVGETGSGKTTQLPQYLYEEGYAGRNAQGKIMKIGCTQPRRVAATSVATRVAEEVGCKLGREVGYSIRFEDETLDATAIKYVTDGMLLREFLTDPTLSTYSALMIDEAHERTVSTEIVLTLLKDLTRERADLKLIVASATINAKKFSDYFDGAPVFTITGRRFPVDICYTKNPEANYIQAAITTVFQIHMKQELPGDILVFLTGQDEIETMEETLKDACDKLGDLIKPLHVAPIYANLPPALQAKIFEPTPPGSRKVVLATNIAETSITIDGIKYVVDPGYVKENVFNATTGMESLVVVPCSRASADQRAGRAGRVGPGKCYRLFTKWSFQNELQANPNPEILRVNLSTVVLLLLSMGVNDLIHFDFIDPPSTQTLMKSLELLYALGALNAKGQLTTIGRRMAEFPMDPMFCKALITSAETGAFQDVLSILAMLSESSSLFYRPKDKKELADKRKESFSHEAGDHLTLLNIWNQFAASGYSLLWCEDNFLQYRTMKRAKDVRAQLEKLCGKINLVSDAKSEAPLEMVQKALLSGFFPNVARLSKLGASYIQLKRKQAVHVHPSSVLFKVKPPPKLVLYHELVLTSKEYMRNCVRIEEGWINEVASHFYRGDDLQNGETKKR